MFEKSLLDLVKGIRSHKDNEAQYINSCVNEIRNEIKSPDRDIKATAVLKLAHVCSKRGVIFICPERG